MLSVTPKLLWLLDTLHFNFSALDHWQSGLWMCCEFLTCTITPIHLADRMIFSGNAGSGSKSKISAWHKSCFELCSCSMISFIADNAAESFLQQQRRSTTKAGSMKLILYWNFLSWVWGWGCLISRGQLAYKREEACKLSSMMVSDALGNIKTKSDSQKISGIETHRVTTWGSGHHQISLDLVLLILWLRAPNFAHW